MYWPVPSVTTVRVFSRSAGLDASTVTPGSTAPDASLTTPAIEALPCALAAAGAIARHTNAGSTSRESLCIGCLSFAPTAAALPVAFS